MADYFGDAEKTADKLRDARRKAISVLLQFDNSHNRQDLIEIEAALKVAQAAAADEKTRN